MSAPRAVGAAALALLISGCGLMTGEAPEPLARTCAEWAELDAEDQLTTTEALVADRMEVVRLRQDVPDTVPEAQILESAMSTIDKQCQASVPGTPLIEAVDRVYPLGR